MPERKSDKNLLTMHSVALYESRYQEALKSWLKSCKDVVNVRSSWGKMKLIIDNRFYDINDMFEFKSGQKCLKVPEGDKVRVTKLK